MSTTPFYDDLIATMPPGLERRIFDVLREHVGEANKIRLDDLCRAVLGVFNISTERQVREAIETLRRDFHVPVISESGKAGRWLAADETELNACIAEMQSRHEHLGDVIRSLRQAQVPATTPRFERSNPVQYSLWS